MDKKQITKSVLHVEKLDTPLGCGLVSSSKSTETLKFVDLPSDKPRLTGIFCIAFKHMNDVYVITCTCLHFYMTQNVGEFVLVTQLSRFTAVITLTGTALYGESVRVVTNEFKPYVTSVKITIYNNYDDYVESKQPINVLNFNNSILCDRVPGSAKTINLVHNSMVKIVKELNSKKK